MDHYIFKHYTYKITWSLEDQEYVGTCEEFPNLSHLDSTHEYALTGIIKLVRGVVADMLEKGEEPPKAIVDENPITSSKINFYNIDGTFIETKNIPLVKEDFLGLPIIKDELPKPKRKRKEKFPVNTLAGWSDIILGKKDEGKENK